MTREQGGFTFPFDDAKFPRGRFRGWVLKSLFLCPRRLAVPSTNDNGAHLQGFVCCAGDGSRGYGVFEEHFHRTDCFIAKKCRRAFTHLS
jgi:hypothetical protein